MEVIKRSKGEEIIRLLVDGSKCVQEIQRAVGGSVTTVEERLKELESDGLVSEHVSSEFPFKRNLTLTESGKIAAQFVNMTSSVISNDGLPELKQKWILSVLYSLGEIKGKTRIEKLLFLLDKEYNLNEKNFYNDFRSERFGPYSDQIMTDVSLLEKIGLVKIREVIFKQSFESGEIIKRTDFQLTEDGKKIAKGFVDKMSPDVKKKILSLKKFNEMKLVELLDFVHRKYKEYSLK